MQSPWYNIVCCGRCNCHVVPDGGAIGRSVMSNNLCLFSSYLSVVGTESMEMLLGYKQTASQGKSQLTQIEISGLCFSHIFWGVRVLTLTALMCHWECRGGPRGLRSCATHISFRFLAFIAFLFLVFNSFSDVWLRNTEIEMLWNLRWGFVNRHYFNASFHSYWAWVHLKIRC